jgi:hypothetical protein
MANHREALATATDRVIHALTTGLPHDQFVAMGCAGRFFDLVGPDMVTRKAKVALEGAIKAHLTDEPQPTVADWLRQLRDALLRM